jgi:hypothetical protein
MLDGSKDVGRPSTNRVVLPALLLDRGHRPQREDLAGAGLFPQPVPSIHITHQPIELRRVLQLDIEITNTFEELAQPDRIRRISVLSELVGQVHFQRFEIRAHRSDQAEYELGPRIAQQLAGVGQHEATDRTRWV